MKRVDIFLIMAWHIIACTVFQNYVVSEKLVNIKTVYDCGLIFIIISLVILYEIRLYKVVPFSLFLGILLFFVFHLVCSLVFGIVPAFRHDRYFMRMYLLKKYRTEYFYYKYSGPDRPI